MRFNNSFMALLGIPDLPERAFIRKADGSILPQGGGGGQPTSTSSTTNTSNIPSYAQPYVENMMGATQSQLFKTQGATDANGNPTIDPNTGQQIQNISGFNPYQAYGSINPDGTPATATQTAQAAVAGFTPLQQQAQSAAANLQTPGQYGTASNMATQAGQGALNTVGQAGRYGAMGANAGQQGANASNMYGAMGAGIGQQAAGQSSMYGNMGANAGQQAAGQSSMYGNMGAMTGQQAAGQSSMYGNMGANAGQQAANASNMYGAMGAGIGQQGANIGASLGQQSQNTSQGPGSVSSYMNPYLQASLSPQEQALTQMQGQQGAAQNAQATQAGAFGGSRAGLQQVAQQSANQQQMGNLIGQGYNTAFNNAQNQMNTANQAALAGNQQALTGMAQGLQGAQQAGSLGLAGTAQGLQGAQQAGSLGIAGANTGLAGVNAQQSGYGQANTAASNLANIGGQNLAAQQSILNTQAQQGQAQQANNQQVINQAIQNYSNAQQYPMMQLGLMSNMLHGLPMQSTTSNMYQAAPNPLLQGIGVAGAGASIYNALNPTSKKKGGITEAVPRHYAGVLASLNDELDNIGAIDPSALAKYAKQTKSPELRRLIQEKAGIPLAPTNMGGEAPGGGIVALAEGGVPRHFDGDLMNTATPSNNTQSIPEGAKIMADNPVTTAQFAPLIQNLSDVKAKQLNAFKAGAADQSTAYTNAAQSLQDAIRTQADKSMGQGSGDKILNYVNSSIADTNTPKPAATPTPGGIAQAAPSTAQTPAGPTLGAPNVGIGNNPTKLMGRSGVIPVSAADLNKPSAVNAQTNLQADPILVEQANKDRIAAETKAKVAAAPKETKEAVKKDVLKKEADKAEVLAKNEKKVVEKVNEAAEDSEFMPKHYGEDVRTYTNELKSAIGLGPNSYKKMDALNKEYENRVLGMDQQAYIMRNLNAAQTFGKLASFRGPVGAGIAAAVGDFASSEANLQDKMQNMKMDALKGQAEIEKGKRAEELGLWTLAAQHYDKASEIAANLKATKMKGDSDLKNTALHNEGAKEVENMRVASAQNVANTQAASVKEVESMRLTGQNVPETNKQIKLQNIAVDLESSLGRKPTQAEILSVYTQSTTPTAETNEQRARSNASKSYEAWDKTLFFSESDLISKAKKGDKDAIAKLEKLKEDKYNQLLAREMGTVNARPTTSPDIAKGEEVTYAGKPFVFQGGDRYDKNNWKPK